MGKARSGNTSIRTGDISNVSQSQIAVGINIKQTMKVSQLSESDRQALLENLKKFREEVSAAGLPPDKQTIVNGKVTEAMEEAEKEKPDVSQIKSLFSGALEKIKVVGSAIEKVAKSETTQNILKILGLGLTLI